MQELAHFDKQAQKLENDDNKNNNKKPRKYILKEMFKGILEGSKSLISDSYFFSNLKTREISTERSP